MKEKVFNNYNPIMDMSDLKNDPLNRELMDAVNSIPQEERIPLGIIIKEVNGEYAVETKGYSFSVPLKPLCNRGRNEKLIVESCRNTAVEKVCLDYINSFTDKDMAIARVYAIYYAIMDFSCESLSYGLRTYTSMLYALITTARNASKYFRGTLFEEMVTKRKKFIRPIRDMWKLNGISINKYI